MFYFLITIFILTFSLGSQFIKMIKNKSSLGISYFAYLFGFLSQLTTFFVADNIYIIYISIYGMIGSALNFFTIFYFNFKNNDMHINIENKIDFFIGLISSLMMIFGVSQAIKSYKHIGITYNVSRIAYIFSIFYALMIVYLSINIFVFISGLLSLFFYSYILYRTYK